MGREQSPALECIRSFSWSSAQNARDTWHVLGLSTWSKLTTARLPPRSAGNSAEAHGHSMGFVRGRGENTGNTCAYCWMPRCYVVGGSHSERAELRSVLSDATERRIVGPSDSRGLHGKPEMPWQIVMRRCAEGAAVVKWSRYRRIEMLFWLHAARGER